MHMSIGLAKMSVRVCRNCQFKKCIIGQFSRYLSSNNTPLVNPAIPARELVEATHLDKTLKNHGQLLKNKYIIKESTKFNQETNAFGTISSYSGDATESLNVDMEEGDRIEAEYSENLVLSQSQKLRTKQYADMIKEHLNQKNLKEAISVLQERMLKQDCVKPENYIYNLLIGGCGRSGQAKQAFHLFNQMKKRGLKVTGGTYTALFNACATTIYPKDGLERANHLRELMAEKGYQPNATNYHAMIKAYGRCGDLATAFALVDEMITQNYYPTQDTFNFLLQACVTDKIAGFRHALLVWNKLRDHKVRPSIYTYNLLLRTVRDCGLGNQEIKADVFLQEISAGSQTEMLVKTQSREGIDLKSNSESEKEISLPRMQKDITTNPLELNNVETNLKLPTPIATGTISKENWTNLLSTEPNLDNIMLLLETEPQYRLLLLGGCSSLLTQMVRDNAEPNIKTFTQLLDIIPGTIAAEKALMNTMKGFGVHLDTDFCNMLMKRRMIRGDDQSAHQVLSLLAKSRLSPSIMTFGILALGCNSEEHAMKLLDEVQASGFPINIEILGTLLKQACMGWSFGFVMEMMQVSIRFNIKPNKQFHQHLIKFHKTGRQMIYDKKHGHGGIEFVNSDYFQKGYKLFCARYSTWLKQVEEEPRPSKLYNNKQSN